MHPLAHQNKLSLIRFNGCIKYYLVQHGWEHATFYLEVNSYQAFFEFILCVCSRLLTKKMNMSRMTRMKLINAIVKFPVL